jgi:hypothetical protein
VIGEEGEQGGELPGSERRRLKHGDVDHPLAEHRAEMIPSLDREHGVLTAKGDAELCEQGVGEASCDVHQQGTTEGGLSQNR